MTEIEVFRLTPIPGKYYETALHTRSVGRYPDTKYYTTNIPIYVGKFIKHISTGYGDSAQHYDIFNDNGKEIIVQYTYEGTTCFREVLENISTDEIVYVNQPISEKNKLSPVPETNESEKESIKELSSSPHPITKNNKNNKINIIDEDERHLGIVGHGPRPFYRKFFCGIYKK